MRPKITGPKNDKSQDLNPGLSRCNIHDSSLCLSSVLPVELKRPLDEGIWSKPLLYRWETEASENRPVRDPGFLLPWVRLLSRPPDPGYQYGELPVAQRVYKINTFLFPEQLFQ